MSNNSALFAVLDTIHGPHKVRLSRGLPFGIAAGMHDALHRGPSGNYCRPVVFPGYTVYGRPVKFLAVRATDDPNWPHDKPILRLKDAR